MFVWFGVFLCFFHARFTRLQRWFLQKCRDRLHTIHSNAWLTAAGPKSPGGLRCANCPNLHTLRRHGSRAVQSEGKAGAADLVHRLERLWAQGCVSLSSYRLGRAQDFHFRRLPQFQRSVKLGGQSQSSAWRGHARCVPWSVPWSAPQSARGLHRGLCVDPSVQTKDQPMVAVCVPQWGGGGLALKMWVWLAPVDSHPRDSQHTRPAARSRHPPPSRQRPRGAGCSPRAC